MSDGTLPPERVVQSYAEAGFDAVAITDHWRIARAPSTASMLTIPAAELGFDLAHPTYARQTGESLVYGISDLPDDPGGNSEHWSFNDEEHWEVRTFADLSSGVRWASSQDAVVYVAHPYWNGLSVEDIRMAEGYAGIEVFNGSAELETGRGDSSPWWDALLGDGRQVFGIGTDDQHYPLFELGAAWTMVRAAERTQEAFLDSLRTGAAYFSHGPSIHDVVVDGSAVEVSCSPARSVILHMEQEFGVSVSVGANGRRLGRILETDGVGLMTRVRLEGDRPDALYRRISVVGADGRRAWTNPF